MPQNRLPAEERRKQILKSAVKIFARANYQSARMADIAAEANISEAMVYKHFKSKNKIYIEVLKHMSTRILAFWKEEIDKTSDPCNTLRNMGITYFKRMSRHPDELKVQFKAIAEVENPEIAKRLHQDHQDYMNLIQQVIKKGIQEGTFRKDVDVLVQGFIFNGMGILMNMMHLLSFKEQFTQKRLTKIIDHLLLSIKA